MKHFDRLPEIETTMNDLYGDESDHVACIHCGCCKTCGDCTCEEI